MVNNFFKLLLIIFSIASSLLICNITPLSSVPASASDDTESVALISRISNITIGSVSNSSFIFSLQLDIYNSNSDPISYQTGSCVLLLGVNSIYSEQATSFSVGYECIASTITLYHGMNTLYINNVNISIDYWQQYGINDLPLAGYQLQIKHTSMNMTAYGATINYNSTGQFFINYEQNPYSFWSFTPNNYQTIVPNTFSRNSVYSSTITTSNSSLATDLSPIIIVVGLIFGILITFSYLTRKKDGMLHKEEKHIKKVETHAGTFQKVVLENICPVCGNKLSATDVFCANCGNRT